MSERSYFSFKYSFPGYTFILIVFLLNFDIIGHYLIEQNLLLAVFSVSVSFFSGSALGFITSQLYWVLSQYVIIFSPIERRRMMGSLKNKYPLLEGKLEGKGKPRLKAILDYIIWTSKDKSIFKFLERRWDIFHVLGAETISTILGCIIGYSLRYQFFPKTGITPSTMLADLLVVWIILICLLAVVVVIFSMLKIKEEYNFMAEVIINESEESKLKKAFPDLFKDTR